MVFLGFLGGERRLVAVLGFANKLGDVWSCLEGPFRGW